MICKVQREGSGRLEHLIGGDFNCYFQGMGTIKAYGESFNFLEAIGQS